MAHIGRYLYHITAVAEAAAVPIPAAVRYPVAAVKNTFEKHSCKYLN